MIPWIYHRLTPRDQAGDLLRIVNFSRESTGANTLISYQVPEEKLLLICCMNWFWWDAAGSSNPWNFTVTEDTNTVLSWQMVSDRQAAVTLPGVGNAASKTLQASPILIASPGQVLNSFISGGTIVQSHIFSFNGILLPHGTFSK